MNLLQRLFGLSDAKKRRPAADRHAHSQSSHPPSSQIHSQTHSKNPDGTRNATRKELLRLALRETLKHNGIPTTWVGADVLVTSSRTSEPGVHVRFLIKQWEPLLLIHAVALQHNFEKRLQALDPEATDWLTGMSWQFNLADESACPALPHPGAWTSPPKFVPARPMPEPVAAATGAAAAGPRTGVHDPSDVAATDTLPSDPLAEAKADLERLFAARDADHARHAAANTAASFAPTEPSKL